ncbi:MAG TPA: hypothetical protein VGG35_10205 [Streptosporangiaceae bacterium]
MGLSAARSVPGQVHVTGSGPLILASHRSAPRIRNADLVKVADWRPRRDLNRGYRARRAKNAPNAACW